MRRKTIGQVLLAASLVSVTGLALAGGWLKPTVSVEPGRGACVAPPEEMRRTHMEMLRHQRDKTLRQGERGAKVSLNGCIECHASKATGSVIASKQDFCEGCHAYAAVKLDCFECHQGKASGKVAASPAGALR